jgi:hypothetical protein
MNPILTEGQKRWMAVAAAVLSAIFLFFVWQSRMDKGPASETESTAEAGKIVASLTDRREAIQNGFDRDIFSFRRINGGKSFEDYVASLQARRVAAEVRVRSLTEQLAGINCNRSVFSIPWPWPKWDCLGRQQELKLELVAKTAERKAVDRVLRHIGEYAVFAKLEKVKRSYSLKKQAEEKLSDSKLGWCELTLSLPGCKDKARAINYQKDQVGRANNIWQSDLQEYRAAQREFKEDFERDAVAPVSEFRASLSSGFDRLRSDVVNYWSGGVKKVLWELLVWLFVFGSFLKAMQAILYYFWAPHVTRLSESSTRFVRAASKAGAAGVLKADVGESESKPVLELDGRVAQRFVVNPESIRSISQDVTGSTSWKFPGLGFAGSLFSGLSSMVQLDLADENTLTLVSPASDGELFLYAVPVGQRLVIDIKHLVAIGLESEQLPKVRRRWHLHSLVAWALGKLRTFEIEGPCALVFSCSRGAAARPVSGELRFSRDVVFAYSSDVFRGVSRTEAFMPYVRGRRALFSEVFAAQGGVVIEDGLRSGGVVRATSTAREGFFGKLLDPVLGLFGL